MVGGVLGVVGWFWWFLACSGVGLVLGWVWLVLGWVWLVAGGVGLCLGGLGCSCRFELLGVLMIPRGFGSRGGLI